MPEGPTCGSGATYSSEAAEVSSDTPQGRRGGCAGEQPLGDGSAERAVTVTH